MDGFTPTCDKIARSASSAQSSIGRASSATDRFSASLNTSESAAGRLVSRIGGLVAAAVSLATAQKVMDISDAYVNTSSRLSLITNSLAQQKQLQNDIFAAAYRSRGAYDTMADSVAKIGIVAGESFNSNGQIVKFAETMQKMFKIGGTSTQDQAAAMLQLTQALGAGKLQGNDFRAIAEDAPLVERAISKYLGKSIGDVRQLSTEGKLTSDVLINSVLKYAGTVDQQFSKMPMTFGDVWNKLKTGATQAFGSVFGNLSSNLNSPGMTQFFNAMIGGFVLAAQAANNLFGIIGSISQFFSQNWSTIAPIIMGIVMALVLFNGIMLAANAIQAIGTVINGVAAASAAFHAGATLMQAAATKTATGAQVGLNIALLACPITWIIAGIIIIIALFYIIIAVIDKMTGQSLSATGIIVGSIYTIGALFKNLGLTIADGAIGMWDVFGALIDNLKVAFPNLWADAQSSFLKFVDVVMTGIANIGDASNKYLKTNFDTSGLKNYISANETTIGNLQLGKSSYQDLGAAFLKGSSTYETFQGGWASNAYNSGYKVGAGFEKSIDPGNILKGLSNLATKSLPGLGNTNTLGTSANPVTVKGTGSGGNVTVNIADQDLQYLRDLAEKQYVNKFSTAVLSPKMNFQYTGTGGSQSDMKKIYTEVGKIMKEGLATAADGWYDD